MNASATLFLQYVKGRPTAQMPQEQNSFKLINIFHLTGQTNFTLSMRVSSLLSSSSWSPLQSSSSCKLLNFPRPLSQSTYHDWTQLPTFSYLHPNRRAKLEKNHSTEYIAITSHLKSATSALNPQQCRLILLFFSWSSFSTIFIPFPISLHFPSCILK